MPTYKFILATLVFTIVSGCDRGSETAIAPTSSERSSGQAASTAQAQREADRLDVIEAVFRHLFNKNASAAQRSVEYFFLSVDDSTDPPPELLARFQDHKPIVLPVSMSTASAADGVKHKEQRGRGLIFRVTQVLWLDKDTADVEGGYYEAGLSASGNTYRMKRAGSLWKVTDDRMNWIS